MPLSWYGLTYLIGFIALTALLYFRFKTRQDLPGVTAPASLLALFYGSYLSLSTIIGGRLGYVFCYEPSFYLSHPTEILALHHGGMSFHGAILGLLLGAILLGYRRHLSFFLLDQATYVALIMLPLGRICNFYNGEIYGTIASPDHPFAFMYVTANGITFRHPVVLYEAAAIFFIIAPILLLYAKRHPQRPVGTSACLFALLYALMRLMLEFWREPDPSVGQIAGLNLGQWLCLGQAIIALGLYLWLTKRKHPT